MLTRHKRASGLRGAKRRIQRSVHELGTVQGFIEDKQTRLASAVSHLSGGFFGSHVQTPLPANNVVLPLGLQPAHNTVIFLHHSSQPTVAVGEYLLGIQIVDPHIWRSKESSLFHKLNDSFFRGFSRRRGCPYEEVRSHC